MNKEIRLSLALVAMVLLLLGLAACGSDDINSTSTNLVGTWTLESYNGIPTAADIDLILNSNASYTWHEVNSQVTCEYSGTYSYAASKITFADTAIGNVAGCDSGSFLNEEEMYGYSSDGSSLKIMGSGYNLVFGN